MTYFVGRFALVVATAGVLSIAALLPPTAEAGVVHQKLGFTTAKDSDVVRIRCDRRLSNLWSCNDEVRSRSRRNTRGRDSYASHPCDHSYQTASDGTRCGNRAADKRGGGR